MKRFTILFILLFIFNCSGTETEILINIYTNYSVPDELDSIELKLFRAESEIVAKEYTFDSKEEFPFRVLITQENGVEEVIGILVRGKKDRSILCESFVQRAFEKNRRVSIDIYLNKENSLIDGGPEDGGTDLFAEITEGDSMDQSEIGSDVEGLEEIGLDYTIDTGCSDSGCGSNAKCINGECQCINGFENCDGKWDNGCEGDILNDPKYCGGCVSDCNPVNVNKALCINGECSYDSCKLMYEDKDQNKKNGCETFNYFPKVYGGDKNEVIEDMLITKDGNILVLSTTESCCFGSKDLWLFKLNKNGDIMWQRVIGGDKEIKSPAKMYELNDSSIIIAGGTNSFGVNGLAGFIIKLDKDGNVIKGRIMDNGEWIGFRKIECDKDLNCLILGSASIIGETGPDIFELYIDSDLSIRSQRMIRILDEQAEIADSIAGNFVVSSKDQALVESNIVVVFNGDRSISYARRVYSNDSLTLNNCIQLQSDGFYCIAQKHKAGSFTGDLVLFKFLYGNQGNIAFKKAFGSGKMVMGNLSRSSNFLNIYLSGFYQDNEIMKSIFIIFESDGSIRLARRFSGSLSEGVLYSLLYNNEIILMGGVSLSYGRGGFDVLISSINFKGEFSSSCHFEEEGDIVLESYEPELFLEDVAVKEIIDPAFNFRDVTFKVNDKPDFGSRSICDK